MRMFGGQRAEPTLKRRLGLLDAISIGLGAIIGAGIFVLIGTAAGMAGPAVFISIVISGLSATFTAMSFGDLATRMPRAGGAYEYGHELISPPVGFLMGWLFIFGNLLVGSTASLGFGHYLETATGFIPFRIGALLSLSLIILFNVMGAKRSALANDLLVLAKVGALSLFIALGLPRIQPSFFDDILPNGPFPVIQAASLFYFAYIGFPRIATTAEEIKDPEVNIRRAIRISLLLSSLIYLFTSITAVGLVGYERLGDSKTPIADASEELGMGSVVEVGALLATLSVVLTSVLGQSRVFFAMARNGEIPHFLSRLHGRYDTPVYSVLLSGMIMIALALSVDITSLAYLSSLCVLFTHILVNYAALKLRGRPVEGSDRTKAHSLHAIVGLTLSSLLIIGMGISTIAMGLLVATAGLMWYAVYIKLFRGAGSSHVPSSMADGEP